MYTAFIKYVTPLSYENLKSLPLICCELIPLLSEIKTGQESNETTIIKVKENLDEKINTINTEISSQKNTFKEKRENIRNSLNQDSQNIINNINTKYSEILNKINAFGDDYFTKHPEVFDKGINDVNFDLQNQNSSYYKNNTRLRNQYKTLDSLYERSTGYWYNKEKELIYNGDNPQTEYGIGGLFKYKEHIIFNDCELKLGEELFPHTENGYFIGFPDDENACYFAKTISETETKYDLKMINLTTKAITTYENLVLPDDFNNIYLASNSHYVIKKYGEYYYILYVSSGGVNPIIARSNDLVHFAKVGEVSASGECTFKIAKDTLYLVSMNSGTFIYNADNSFTLINANYLVFGEFKTNILFMDKRNNSILFTLNTDLSGGSVKTSGQLINNLNYHYYSNKNRIYLSGYLYALVLEDPFIISREGNYPCVPFKEKITAKMLPLELNNMVVFDSTSNVTNLYNREMIIPVHLSLYGDFVVDNNGNIWSDYNLQNVILTLSARSIGT